MVYINRTLLPQEYVWSIRMGRAAPPKTITIRSQIRIAGQVVPRTNRQRACQENHVRQAQRIRRPLANIKCLHENH